MNKCVLMIDDDLNVCREIQTALQDSTTDVTYTLSAQDGFALFTKRPYCLIIMDVLLSATDGLGLLQAMRKIKPVPILVLSSTAEGNDKVAVLQAGANAYLEKPYVLEECLAQAKSLMQLYLNLNPPEQRWYTLAFGFDLVIDPLRRFASLKGKPLHLTRTEFNLLLTLANHAGQVLSREQLYTLIWPSDADCDIDADAAVNTHLKTLRKKLRPADREYVKNVWGVGYYFDKG